jgi:hypothetical protein
VACDLLGGHPALTQVYDQGLPSRDDPRRRTVRPRRAIKQPGGTFGAMTGEPFAHRAHAHAGHLRCLSRRPAELPHAPDQQGTTVGRRARIRVAVHPGGSPVAAGIAHRSLSLPLGCSVIGLAGQGLQAGTGSADRLAGATLLSEVARAASASWSQAKGPTHQSPSRAGSDVLSPRRCRRCDRCPALLPQLPPERKLVIAPRSPRACSVIHG